MIQTVSESFDLCVFISCFLSFSDDNLSEDDLNECEKEDPLHDDCNESHPDYVSKKKKKMEVGIR